MARERQLAFEARMTGLSVDPDGPGSLIFLDAGGGGGVVGLRLTVDSALVDNLFALGHRYRLLVEDLGEVRPEERL